MTNDQITTFTLRIANANKTEMMVILYDIALTYVSDAKKALEYGDKTDYRNQIEHIKSTVRELMNSVNPSVNPGRHILSLYVYCNQELTKASLDYDIEALSNAERIFEKFRTTYEEVAKKDKTAAVMEHTETIYSGLTYNKNSKQESFSAENYNRGFLV